MSIKKITWFEPEQNIGPEIMDEIQNIWADKELGNDNYFTVLSPEDKYGDEEDFWKNKYPNMAKYLADRGFGEEEIYLHWWW